MSELQWLIYMLTKQKLQPKLKDMFISRIGEVESRLSTPQARPVPMMQAPSTQKLLNEIELGTPVIPKRIIGGDVDNGDGTKGKRKF